MNIVKVSGKKNKHKVLMYALSTCAWCKMTKQFLKDNSVEYEYVDVDLAADEDLRKIKKDIMSLGGTLSYPAIIVDGKTMINGFKKDQISEALEL